MDTTPARFFFNVNLDLFGTWPQNDGEDELAKVFRVLFSLGKETPQPLFVFFLLF